MAISMYEVGGGQIWRVYVNIRSKADPTIREQKVVKGIKSEAAAISEEKKLLRQLSQEVSRREGLGLTWGTILERWELSMRAPNAFVTYSPQTIMDYVALLQKWMGHWSGRPAREISRSDVREVIQDLRGAGMSVSYQNRVKCTINTVFTWGLDERHITGVDRSPTYGVQVAKTKEEVKPEILNIDQIRSLLTKAKTLDNEWYPVWATALLTGMRNGELYALEWSDVDLETKKITVSKSYNKRLRIIKSTKAGYWRTVPISEELYRVLVGLRLRSGGKGHVLPRFWKWTQGLQAQALRGFCEGVGLPSIRFHTLRACFATQLLRNNIAPAVVMKICGWKDFKTMMKYLRLSGIDEAGATDCLQILPDEQVMATVSQLFSPDRG